MWVYQLVRMQKEIMCRTRHMIYVFAVVMQDGSYDTQHYIFAVVMQDGSYDAQHYIDNEIHSTLHSDSSS